MIPGQVVNMRVRVERITEKMRFLSAKDCLWSRSAIDVFAVVDRDASYKFTRSFEYTRIMTSS